MKILVLCLKIVDCNLGDRGMGKGQGGRSLTPCRQCSCRGFLLRKEKNRHCASGDQRREEERRDGKRGRDEVKKEEERVKGRLSPPLEVDLGHAQKASPRGQHRMM